MEADNFERAHSVEKWYPNRSPSRSKLNTAFQSLIFKCLNIIYHEQSECSAHALWFHTMHCIITLQSMLTSSVCCFPFRISPKIVYRFPSPSGILHAQTIAFINSSSRWWVHITNLFQYLVLPIPPFLPVFSAGPNMSSITSQRSKMGSTIFRLQD